MNQKERRLRSIRHIYIYGTCKKEDEWWLELLCAAIDEDFPIGAIAWPALQRWNTNDRGDIQPRDLMRPMPKQWLNDHVIDVYLKRLASLSKSIAVLSPITFRGYATGANPSYYTMVDKCLPNHLPSALRVIIPYCYKCS